MMFWERFYNLCNSHGIKPNAVCAKLGLSTATATHWKNGSIPKGDAISKLSDYFHVSADYLLGRTDNPSSPAPAEDKELSKVDIMISTEAKDLSDKDKQEILTFIQYKKFQKETGSSSTSPGARTFTTADFEDNTERIAAFGGMEENDDEPLTT